MAPRRARSRLGTFQSPPEFGKRRPQIRVADLAHGLGDLDLLGIGQATARRRRRPTFAPGQRRLDQAQTTDRAVAEVVVDPLQDLRFAVLQFESGSAGYVQHQHSARLIGPRAQADRVAAGREHGADDGWPFGEQLGFGQPAPPCRGLEHAPQQIGQSPQTSATPDLLRARGLRPPAVRRDVPRSQPAHLATPAPARCHVSLISGHHDLPPIALGPPYHTAACLLTSELQRRSAVRRSYPRVSHSSATNAGRRARARARYLRRTGSSDSDVAGWRAGMARPSLQLLRSPAVGAEC